MTRVMHSIRFLQGILLGHERSPTEAVGDLCSSSTDWVYVCEMGSCFRIVAMISTFASPPFERVYVLSSPVLYTCNEASPRETLIMISPSSPIVVTQIQS